MHWARNCTAVTCLSGFAFPWKNRRHNIILIDYVCLGQFFRVSPGLDSQKWMLGFHGDGFYRQDSLLPSNQYCVQLLHTLATCHYRHLFATHHTSVHWKSIGVSCRLGHSSKVGNSHTQTDGDDARQMHGPCCAYCAGIVNNNFSVSTQRSSHQRTFGTRGFRKLLYGLILINLWVPTNIT